MSLKSKIKITFGLICVFAVMLLSLLIVLYLYLPQILESKLIPQLTEASGITELNFSVRSIGLFGADLGGLQIGSEKRPALIVRSIQIDYSPSDLYQKKIKKVIASGIEFYCEFNNGRFGIRGFDLQNGLKRRQSPRNENSVKKNDTLPLFVESVAIRNGTVILDANGSIYRIPFEFDISADDRRFDKLTFAFVTRFRGQEVEVGGDLDMPKRQMSLGYSAPSLNLAKFADITELIEGLAVSGTANIAGSAAMQIEPFKITSVTALLKLKNSDIKYNNVHFVNPIDDQKDRPPFSVKIETTGGKKWKLEASDLTTIFPVPIRFNKISSIIELNNKGTKSSGSMQLSLVPPIGPEFAALPIRVTAPLHLPVHFSADFIDREKWQIDIDIKPRKKDLSKAARLKLESFEITSKPPVITVTCTGNGKKIGATYTARLSKVQARNKDVNLFLSEIVLTGRADIEPKRGARKIAFKLQLPAALMKRKPMDINFDNVVLSGSAVQNSKGTLNIDSEARLTGIGVRSPRSKFQCKGIRIKLPLRWPAKKPKKKGILAISALHYGKFELGALKADLNQTETGISFTGKISNELIPEMSAKFSGDSDLFNSNDYATKVHFEVLLSEAAPEISLGRFLPAAKGFTFKGKLFEEGDLYIGKNGFSATVTSVLSNGRLAHRQNNIEIEGIETTLAVTALPMLRSAPGQQMKFSKASIGGLNLLDGRINFQIESPRVLLIEQSQFKWCDGNVDAPAIRLKSGVQDYKLILYCIGLNLAKVLEEFGVASVEAQGKLDGRIAVRYQNGSVSFDDGFLYSIPEKPAKIRMLDTEILTAGIPPDTPQYMQMELARKALENYEYDWASLNIATEGEDLLLQLKLDGKPADKLPFVYRKDIGSFAKVEAGVEGSEFEGIRLDVNFRLPLNKIMQYKDLIRMIQQEKE